MPKKKNEAYVVYEGRRPGIYYSWGEAEKQVKKFTGAKHKGFKSRAEAAAAFEAHLANEASSSSPLPPQAPQAAAPQAPQPAPESSSLQRPIDAENRGHRMLRSMGWEAGTGLGAHGKGITSPIPLSRPAAAGRSGIGASAGASLGPEQETVLAAVKAGRNVFKVAEGGFAGAQNRGWTRIRGPRGCGIA